MHHDVLSPQSMAVCGGHCCVTTYQQVSRLQQLSTQETSLQQRPLCVAVFLARSSIEGRIVDMSIRTLRRQGYDNSSIGGEVSQKCVAAYCLAGDFMVATALASSCVAASPFPY